MRLIEHGRLAILGVVCLFTTACATDCNIMSHHDALSPCNLELGALLIVTAPVMIPAAIIQNASEERKRTKESRELLDRVKAGDLATSEDCVASLYCDYVWDARLPAAENVLNAYQNEPEPGLEKQVLLIRAHRIMYLKSPENRRTHLEAIVQFGESQAPWDYINKRDTLEGDKKRFPGMFQRARVDLNESVIDLLVMDHAAKVAGDPYQPFTCNFAPYQKAAALSRNHYLRSGTPCEEAEEEWYDQAISDVKKQIESGDLAAAQRCMLECANIKGESYIEGTWNAKRLRRLAADSIIKAYENMPDLDSQQQAMLEEARALKPEPD